MKDGGIIVPAESKSGFEVWARVEGNQFIVAYGHWHEYFEAEEEAVNCVMSGVFGESRLAVERRGGFAQSWTAEALIDGEWVPISKTALFLFPFWRKRTIEYFRNDRKPREHAE